MQLISNSNLQNPNVCTICEEGPFGDSVIDTERYTPFAGTYPLNGRKYVCVRCGGEIAKTIGYEAGADVAVAQASNEAARAELSNVRARVVELADSIKEFVTGNVGVDPAASAAVVQAIVDSTTSAAKAAVESASQEPVVQQDAPADTSNTDPQFDESGAQVVNEDAKAVDEQKVADAAALDQATADLVAAKAAAADNAPAAPDSFGTTPVVEVVTDSDEAEKAFEDSESK